jgi:hypothetical protein
MARAPEKIKPGLVSAADIASIGRATFGQQWQPQMATALKVADQVVRRWTNDGCPTDMLPRLRQMLADRAVAISNAEHSLEKYETAD